MDLIKKAEKTMLSGQADRLYKSGEYEQALEKYLKILEYAIELRENSEAARYHELVGDCYEKLDHHKKEDMVRDHVQAGEHYIKSANLYVDLGDHEKAGEVFEKGAKTLEELEKYDKAADFHLKSAQMFIDRGDFFNASFSYHNAAEYYEKDGQYEKAAKSYLDAAMINMKVKDTSSASTGFKHAGKSYEKEKMWDKAIEAYSGAVEIDLLDRKYLDVAESYEDIAHAYLELKDYKNSIYHHLKAAEIRVNNSDLPNAAYSFREAGNVYYQTGEYKKAVENFIKSANIYVKSKNAIQAAASFIKSAEAHLPLGEYEQAGKNFVDAAKQAEVANNPTVMADGYSRAAYAYDKYADVLSEQKEYERAAQALLTAAICFESMKDYEMAANKYLEYADVMWELNDKKSATNGYRMAAEEYIKSGRLLDAGEAFYYTEDYDKSAETFIQYAKAMEEAKQSYSAGVGHLNAGVSYKRMNNHGPMKQNLLKAISLFTKYMEGFTKPPDKGDELVQYGDGRRMLGEAHQYMLEYREAQRQYSKAVDAYEKTGDGNRVTLGKALLLKMEAEFKIDHGYYPEASELLDQDKKLLEETIKNGGWRRMYVDYLKESLKDVEELIEMIELKPKVILDVDQRSYTFANIPLILNVMLTNTGRYTMRKITYLEHLPEEIKLTRLPEYIPELESNGLRRGSIELTPTKTGFYRLKPIEVYYEDQEGHKYVKASNEVSVEVVERPPTDYKSYHMAVEIFLKYAKSQEENSNWFQAGDGYREAAETYGRFHTDETLQGYYKNAVENYMKYAGENAGKESDDPTKVKRLADSLWYAGESYRFLETLEEAAKVYEESVQHYRACKMLNMANRSMAFKLKAEGTVSIKHGEYGRAEEQLKESLKYFNEVVKAGGFDMEHIRFLEKNEDEIHVLINTIKGKPEISVSVRGPAESAVGDTLTYKATIANPQNFTVKMLRPVVRTVDGIIIVRKADLIPEIAAGKTIEIEFQVKPVKRGQYRFNPLDVAYKDDKGNAYMKGSNDITLNATGEEAKAAEAEAAGGKDAVLEIDAYSYSLVNNKFILNAELFNKSGDKIREVNFLTNVPPALKVDLSPDPLLELPASGSKKVSIELTPLQAGEYHVRPLEAFYQDPAGHKYVKASNEVTIEVVERPPTDYKNYVAAIEVFVKYAKSQQENRNWFQAGDGYREAAETYGRFHTDETLQGYYKNAVENYMKYAGENAGKEKDDPTKVKRLADSLWYAGICLMNAGETKNAVERLGESLKNYEQARVEDMKEVAQAYINELKGRIELEQSKYESAEKYLKDSLKTLDKLIKAGGFQVDFLKNLEKTRGEVQLMLDNLKAKPDVLVKVEAPEEVGVGENFAIETSLSNMSTSVVMNLRTEAKTPEGLKLNKAPEEVKRIDPGKTVKVAMELSASKEGRYTFKPLTIKYGDPTGKNYIQGSPEVTIKASSAEAMAEAAAEGKEGPAEAAKSEVELEVKQPANALPNEPIQMKVAVTNNGKSVVTGVRFIGNPVEGLDMGEQPETIEKLAAGERKEFEFTVTPEREGEFIVKPLEMFYKDQYGNRFFKASNEITIKAAREVKAVEVKAMAALEKGLAYLLEDEDRKLAVKLFDKQVEEGYSGLYITRVNPDQIRQEYKMAGAKFLWLTDVKSSGEYRTASDPQEISMSISEFIDAKGKTVIMLEGIEYLINTSGFGITLEFIQFIRDKVSTKDSKLIILANPSTLDQKQMQSLEHECILYRK